MRHITHIITGLGVGGAERALYNLLTGGLQDRFKNRVISLIDEGAYGSLLRKEGIQVECVDMTPGRPTLTAIAKLLRRANLHTPDIIQGWMYHGNIAASLIRHSIKRQTALAWNVRSSLEDTAGLQISTKSAITVGAWLSNGPDAIIYNSARSSHQHADRGYATSKMSVIPNGFDTTLWRPNPNARIRLIQELGLAPDVFLVGFVGRSHRDKDISNLFEAFVRVSQRAPHCHLVAVGRNLVEAAPDHLNPERVSFLGQRDDVHTIMPAFDLLCLSSRTEGFPNVVGEAMACGVPCVSTDVGDASTIIADTGWIVPSRNSVSLAEAILSATALPGAERLRRSTESRKRIEQNYSISAAVNRYGEMYSALLKQTDLHRKQ